MTIACIASLSVCMTLNDFASLVEVNVGSMVAYLGSQNETVVYLDPESDDATNGYYDEDGDYIGYDPNEGQYVEEDD